MGWRITRIIIAILSFTVTFSGTIRGLVVGIHHAMCRILVKAESFNTEESMLFLFSNYYGLLINETYAILRSFPHKRFMQKEIISAEVFDQSNLSAALFFKKPKTMRNLEMCTVVRLEDILNPVDLYYSHDDRIHSYYYIHVPGGLAEGTFANNLHREFDTSTGI